MTHIVSSLKQKTVSEFEAGQWLLEKKEDLSESEWNDLIQSPEIGLTSGEAMRLVNMYKIFILDLEITDIEDYKLNLLNMLRKPYLDGKLTKEQVEKLLDRAHWNDEFSLTAKDFKEEIQDIKSKDTERTFKFMVMIRCNETGSMTKVQSLTDEEIREKFNLKA